MKICLQSSNKNISNFLIKQLNLICEITLFNLTIKDFNHFDVVLIVEPFEIITSPGKPGEYSSICRIWRRYLKRETEQTKLIIAGFEQIDHSNYLQILELDKDFDFIKFTSNSKICSEDWEDEVITNGICLLEKLSLFFKGHNEHGIIDTIARIRGNLNNAYLHYEGSQQLIIKPKSFETIWMDFLKPIKDSSRVLYNRWYNYKTFFKPYPFNFLLENCEIDQFITDLRELTKDKGRITLEPENLKKKEDFFVKIDAYHKIDKVIKLFEKINKRYINIENVGVILLIDDDEEFHHHIYQSFPSYEIIHAYNKKEALTIINEKEIDIILLDLNIETNQQDGLDLLPLLKDKNKELPVVIVSTIDDEKIIKRTFKKGASYYLRKTQFDAAFWNRIFVHILGGKSFSIDDVLNYNDSYTNSKTSILIIEDEELWFKQVKGLSSNFNCEWARTIQQAKDKLKETTFDLILLDLYFEKNKKEKEGMKFIPEIKKISDDTPIIVFTIDDNVKTSTQAINNGASYFLRKDRFDSVIWLQTLELVINQNRKTLV